MKPRRLRRGDTVGIVSPSWGGVGAYPRRAEQAVRGLEALGLRVRYATHARGNGGVVSDTAEHRADDLHEMFADPTIHAIMASIGGDHSCHLLPLLDADLIRANPKIVVGYSDMTVLTIAIWKLTGLVTFNGPALLTDFGEWPETLPYTRHWFERILIDGYAGRLEPSTLWTDEFLDWGEHRDRERPRSMRSSAGWTALRGGIADGQLIGGCIESLQHLRGTRFWPDWRGAVLFIETSENRPSPATVDGLLMDYENMGVLGDIGALLVGRPYGYSDAERHQLHAVLLERTRRWSFPVIADVDVGHTAPQVTLPIGIRARVDGDRCSVALLEPAVV